MNVVDGGREEKRDDLVKNRLLYSFNVSRRRKNHPVFNTRHNMYIPWVILR